MHGLIPICTTPTMRIAMPPALHSPDPPAAAIASRPGQSGRCDGYILEGKELEFYTRKLKTKRSK